MNALILLLIVIIIYFIFDNAKKRDNLETYRRQNNASFVAEVEEFAKWSEQLFREYCDLVGVDSALSEIKHGTTLYNNGNGFYMPNIIIQRRGELGRNFNEAFSNFKNLNTIEILRLRYNLPDNDLIQFDAVTQKTLRLYNSASYHKKYYKNIYQIIYLNVFLSLKVRQYNISKSGIMEDEITEHQQIRKVIELYPWLSGEFKRY